MPWPESFPELDDFCGVRRMNWRNVGLYVGAAVVGILAGVGTVVVVGRLFGL